MPRMITFKYVHSDKADYKAIAKRMFGDNKCIVSPLEPGKSGRDHVHFIGYTDLSVKDEEEELGEIKAEHPAHDDKDEDGNPNFTVAQLRQIVRSSGKRVCEAGFQYVMKTNKKPRYSQGFEEEELEELKAASDEHVDKLKSGAKELVHGKKYTGSPQEIFDKMQMDILEYNIENNIPFRPQFKRACLWIMVNHPDCTTEWKRFVLKQV